MKTVELYSENPFRVLGIPSTASIKDAARSADRLLRWTELGETPPANDDLPFIGPLRLDVDKIKKAKQEIEEPRSRIRSELFWFSAEFAQHETCQKFLREGHYKDFVAHCEYAISRESVPGQESGSGASLARHHLAVFYHSAAIAVARRTAKSVGGGSLPVSDWEQAFRYWLLVQKDDVFWAYLANRVRLLGDPRLKTEYLSRLRQVLLSGILNVNVGIGLEGLDRGELTELLSQTRVISSSPFSQQLRNQACESLAAPLRRQFENSRKDVQAHLSDKAISAFVSALPKLGSDEDFQGSAQQEKIRGHLTEIERSIMRRILPIVNRVKEANLQSTGAGIEVLDGAAYLLRALCLALNNEAGLPGEALRVANIAQRYSATQECKQRLMEDQRTLNFLFHQEEALDLAKVRRYRESLAKLELALQFASTSEEKETIQQWKEQAQKLVTYEGLEPIQSAPSLYTLNGIGTMLYGRRDVDATTNSYVATLYFTFLFIPVIPIAAYRVIDVGGGAYRFLGKVPLSRAAFAAPGVLVALFLFAVVSSNVDTGSPERRGIPPATPSSSSTPSVPRGRSQSPGAAGGIQFEPDSRGGSSSRGTRAIPSTSRNEERERLGVWIEQEASRLKLEKQELERIQIELDLEKARLDQEFNDLNSRRPTQFEVDSYEEARQRYNARVGAFNARVRKFNSDATRLREQAKVHDLMY